MRRGYMKKRNNISRGNWKNVEKENMYKKKRGAQSWISRNDLQRPNTSSSIASTIKRNGKISTHLMLGK